MSSLSKLLVRGSASLAPWRLASLSRVMLSGRFSQQTSFLLNSRLLLTAFLSTTAVTAARTDHILDKPTAIDSLTAPPPGCCIITPLVYSRRYWRHQSCLAGDLIELPHIGHFIGRSHAVPPARYFATDSEGGEECHKWYDIDTQDFVEMVKKSERGVEHLQLFDVREPEELQETGELPGSINIPLGSVEDAFNMSPEDFKAQYGVERPTMDDPNIVFSCRAGVRSLSAMESVHRLGYINARHYMRGWLGWQEHLEKEKSSEGGG